jgi:hypothetical protein
MNSEWLFCESWPVHFLSDSGRGNLSINQGNRGEFATIFIPGPLNIHFFESVPLGRCADLQRNFMATSTFKDIISFRNIVVQSRDRYQFAVVFERNHRLKVLLIPKALSLSMLGVRPFRGQTGGQRRPKAFSASPAKFTNPFRGRRSRRERQIVVVANWICMRELVIQEALSMVGAAG